jgi:hypothetical protein
MVAEQVGNTLVLVFFEFQQKTKTREAWVRLVTEDLKIDASLRNQIPQQTVYVCERHFDKHLIENVSSFLNLIGFLVDVLIFRYERLKVNTAYQKLVYISCIKFVWHMEQEIYKYTDLHKEDNLYIDNCSQA